MPRARENPVGVLATTGFFAGAGLLELVLGWRGLEPPLTLWLVSGVVGRASLYVLLAAGLWRRYAVCRSVAMVYCLAALITHGVVLGLAFAHAPVRFPESVMLSSLYEVPSCALLLPYLRSRRAADLFFRPLLAGAQRDRRRPPAG